jgi:hypothetical protein
MYSKTSIIHHPVIRQFLLTVFGGEPLCVGGVGGKVHAFLIIWCVACS